MQVVTLNVALADKLETPEPKLEEGEFIVKRVVPLSRLYQELKGVPYTQYRATYAVISLVDYGRVREKRGEEFSSLDIEVSATSEADSNMIRPQNFMVDARLMHIAAGFDLAEKIRSGDFP